MNEERWVTISDYPNYAISDQGRVKRLTSMTRAKAGAILKTPPRSKSCPYPCVDLCRPGGKRTELVHILVARAFLPVPTFIGAEVNHRNGDKTDPAYTNLEWTTSSGNSLHAYQAGLACATGESNGQAKLTEQQVLAMRAAASGHRGEIAALARTHKVSGRTVSDIISRRRWTHI